MLHPDTLHVPNDLLPEEVREGMRTRHKERTTMTTEPKCAACQRPLNDTTETLDVPTLAAYERQGSRLRELEQENERLRVEVLRLGDLLDGKRAHHGGY